MDYFSQSLQIEYADKGVIIQVAISLNPSFLKFSKDHLLMILPSGQLQFTGGNLN
jgi:hypothetical protein